MVSMQPSAQRGWRAPRAAGCPAMKAANLAALLAPCLLQCAVLLAHRSGRCHDDRGGGPRAPAVDGSMADLLHGNRLHGISHRMDHPRLFARSLDAASSHCSSKPGWLAASAPMNFASSSRSALPSEPSEKASAWQRQSAPRSMATTLIGFSSTATWARPLGENNASCQLCIHRHVYLHFNLVFPNYPCIYLPIYLPSNLSIYPCIYPSIHLSVYSSIHLSIHLPTYLPTYLSIYLSIYLSYYLSLRGYVYEHISSEYTRLAAWCSNLGWTKSWTAARPWSFVVERLPRGLSGWACTVPSTGAPRSWYPLRTSRPCRIQKPARGAHSLAEASRGAHPLWRGALRAHLGASEEAARAARVLAATLCHWLERLLSHCGWRLTHEDEQRSTKPRSARTTSRTPYLQSLRLHRHLKPSQWPKQTPESESAQQISMYVMYVEFIQH